MNSKRIIAMDLDGTLLNEKGLVSDESINYLKNIKENGDIIVIATGRILNSALFATKGAEFASYIVGNAGAGVYKNAGNDKWEKIYEELIPYNIAESFLEYFDENKFSNVSLCNSQKICRYTKNYHKNDKVVVNYESKEELEKDIKDVIHVSIGLKNNNLVSEYYKIFKDEYPDLKISIMQDSFGEKRWLEITKKDIEKYKGINRIAKIENIPNENIIAFGDGLNDLDMLAKCGIGVAMKNALPEVKKVAKFTTNKANYENGIIDFLENMNKSAEV